VLVAGGSLDDFRHPDWRQPVAPGSYVHALVTNVLPYQVTARIGQQQLILGPDDFAWTGQRDAENFLHPGDIIYVHIVASADSNLVLHAVLEQDSGIQGSLMAVDNTSGEVLAMVGGRDFNLSQFNRATQAERQTGSSFKPYVYAAAVEAGARPDETIVDAPVTFSTAVGPYTPHNYDDTFEGTVSLVHAFADSRNIPAVKLAERDGIRKVRGGYARGAGCGLQQLSQRWSSPGSPPDPQGNQRGWAHAVREPGQRRRVHHPEDGARHDDLVQGSHWTGRYSR
jgi:penicillin-binding protein 1A